MEATFKTKLKQGFTSGCNRGWRGYVWILKILIPVSLLTAFIEYTGIIETFDFVLAPAMKILGLPSMAALPLLAGMLTGIYGAVASLMILPFTEAQMTLIAIFVLISHSLIQEGIIQGKSGLNPLRATLYRLTASVLTVVAVSWILEPQTIQSGGQAIVSESPAQFWIMMKTWALATFSMCLKMFIIIMALMMVLELMKSFNMISHVVKSLNPIIRLLGLDREVSLLWLTAALFGISYGAAVIVEETRDNEFSRHSLHKLHISIGINHAMVEDPALFLPLGLNPFWLWLPRLLVAVLAAHAFSLIYRFKALLGRDKTPGTVKISS